MPCLKLAVVHDEKAARLTPFALNRHREEELVLETEAKGLDRPEVEQALELPDSDLQATNTRD
ncbi:MAG: alpha-N-arabinofuranosidase, partial [Geminicoccaceae bacterium]